ncbi:MAG: TatD family hydrolase [Peptoniphilaceae bacterium]|uniref:TatD family hydrolase n=1 Tax=Parvimonas sp. TaxID=1944660 RepID=UPI0025F9D155|nr:TatD family hydrolase [Parvimonas sp.]MCI5997357.1 TatD family hydrolase [Parvimonas sp.]MDD7765412.1 TatD family hydrolase [Peptoniphilaceae bacterium]MDY3050678.1 TatD family hydrolase [Parvimonas sp.]
MKIVDSHCHIDDERFDSDREELISLFEENEIDFLIDPASDVNSGRKILELVKKYDKIYGAVGIHPHEVEGITQKQLDEIYEMSFAKKIVAIGEIGLDYYYDNSPKDKQKEIFRKQMEIAKKRKLPVIIHTRDAMGDTYDILSEFRGEVIGVMHCYTGSLEMAKRFMELGYYISISGAVTFKNAVNVREMAKEIPLDNLLVETDSPYLTPEPHRGKRNEPKFVRLVAEKIAELKNMEVNDLIYNTNSNARNLFSIEE